MIIVLCVNWQAVTWYTRFYILIREVTVSLLALLLSAQIALCAPAKIPAKAEQLLSMLPGKKLTLDFILKKAMQESSSFQALEAGLVQAESTSLSADGPYDWTLLGSYSYLDSRADAASPFNPRGTEARGWNVGVRKRLPTGTSLEAKYGNSFNRIFFADPAFRIPDYYENSFSASLSQDLWANFLGQSSRAGQAALVKESEVQKLDYEEAKEKWSLDIIDQFHKAWLAQRRLSSARENFERRQELLQVTRLKSRRGTAERPDVLQVESAFLLAESAVSQAEIELDHIWRSLVVMLNLSEEWLAVPAALIPIELSPAPKRAVEVCEAGTDPNATRKVQRAQLGLEAAELAFKRAQSDQRPRLQLVGTYETNGINRVNSESRTETLKSIHPATKVALQLEIPLGDSSQRSQSLQARANLIRSRGELEAVRDTATVNLKQNCEYLRQAKGALEAATKASSNQRERIRLEERRFQVGRSTTFQVIQAGDDHANTDQTKNQNEVALRQLAWEVIQESVGLEPFFEKWMK